MILETVFGVTFITIAARHELALPVYVVGGHVWLIEWFSLRGYVMEVHVWF